MSGPEVWGPHGWKFIHYITLGYPNNPKKADKDIYYNFFNVLKWVIPCSICGAHFRENFLKTPLDDTVLSNRTNMIAWGIKMHNHVNEKNKKKIYTYAEGLADILKEEECIVKEKMTNSITNCNNLNISLLLNIIFLFVIIIIAVKLYKK